MDGLGDGKTIKGIYYPDDCSNGYTVGREGVTRIEVYYENGQMAPVPWFEVWTGDVLKSRLNAAHITEVVYG